MKKLTLQEEFAKWDKGKYTYSPVQYALLKNKEGEKISKDFLELLGECTVCEVGNATCIELFEVSIHGFHPGKPLKIKKISICPLGCTLETCILNK